MNPVDILRQAFDAVIKAEIPDDLREIAFSKAVDLIHAPVTTSTQNRSTAYDRQTSNGEVLVEQADEDSDIIDRMASRLEVDVAIIERVFREHDGEPHLKLLTNQLPSGKTPATREIALLITAARQSLGLEEYTPVEQISKEAEHFSKYDSSNFAAAIKGIEQYFRVRGPARNKEVKLNQPGWEAAVDLIKQKGGGQT